MVIKVGHNKLTVLAFCHWITTQSWKHAMNIKAAEAALTQHQ